MAEILWGSYEKLSDKQRMEAIEIIFKSSNRLESFGANIISLSKLSRPSYKLKFAQID